MTERILITGGTGFVGSNIIPKLLDEGHSVWSVQRYVTGRYGKLDASVAVRTLDLTDYERVGTVLKEINPDVVIHLGAITSVGYSYDSPTELMRVNALGSINLAERCRELPNLRHFIAAGTTEEYGLAPDRPANERTKCVPNSPYSVSKYATTKYLQYMWMAHEFPMTIMRATNSYGRVNDVNFVIEKAISQMLSGQVVRLGDPYPIRDFMYVDDHVSGYLAVLHNREKSLGEIFNMSTGTSHRIAEVVDIIKNLIGFNGPIQWGGKKRPLDIIDHRIDSTKIRKTLGWEPKFTLEQGLTKTIEAIKATRDAQKP
jgi:nucleoside-diphosphate-sugar epimerase